jgi:hypothetical protein
MEHRSEMEDPLRCRGCHKQFQTSNQHQWHLKTHRVCLNRSDGRSDNYIEPKGDSDSTDESQSSASQSSGLYDGAIPVLPVPREHRSKMEDLICRGCHKQFQTEKQHQCHLKTHRVCLNRSVGRRDYYVDPEDDSDSTDGPQSSASQSSGSDLSATGPDVARHSDSSDKMCNNQSDPPNTASSPILPTQQAVTKKRKNL